WYPPTIRALGHARRGLAPVAGSNADAPLVVAMPTTPGAPDLPGATAEAAGLRGRFPGQVTVLTGSEVTHDAVLAAMRGARSVHFACHGVADLVNPSASGLILGDRQRLLTVGEVSRLRLDDAVLAYLSACSTARPGGRLADEAIHLVSAFQLAGYRHVIGTLW